MYTVTDEKLMPREPYGRAADLPAVGVFQPSVSNSVAHTVPQQIDLVQNFPYHS